MILTLTVVAHFAQEFINCTVLYAPTQMKSPGERKFAYIAIISNQIENV
jgi:hypothetical protein